MSLKLLGMSLLISLSISSFAAGPSTGGGGDVIRLPDDSVVLADPFLNHGGQQPNNMPPLRSLNPRLLQTAQSYLSVLGIFNDNEIYKEVQKLTRRESGLRFYGVRDSVELNMFCASGGRKSYSLPSGAKVEQAACTAGNETFLVEPLFLQLTLRQQVLLLIHERLTTLRDQYGGKNYSAIARFTTGLNIYLDLIREQQLKKYRQLSNQETNKLNEFYNGADEILYRNSNNPPEAFAFTVHSYGGGRLDEKSVVSPSAMIGANVIVTKSTIEDGAQVLEGSTLKDSRLAAKSYVRKSNIIKSKLGFGSKINESTLFESDLAERTSVERSFIEKSSVGVGSRVSDVGRFQSSQIAANVVVENGSFVISSKIGKNSAINRVAVVNSELGSKFQAKNADAYHIKSGDSLSLSRVTLMYRYSEDNEAPPDWWKPYMVFVRGNQKIENAEVVWKNFENYAPVGYTYRLKKSVTLSLPWTVTTKYDKAVPSGSYSRSLQWEKIWDVQLKYEVKASPVLFGEGTTSISQLRMTMAAPPYLNKSNSWTIGREGEIGPIGAIKKVRINRLQDLVGFSGDISEGSNRVPYPFLDFVKRFNATFEELGAKAWPITNEVILTFDLIPPNGR